MPLLKTVFWGSAAALAWTHVGYPLATGALARARARRVAKDTTAEPSVVVIVAAHNEETVIERRLANLLALDYPHDRLEVVVASDASSDRTNELVEAVALRAPRVRLLDCPRGGKVAAQDRAVRETTSDVVAFSDANATWAPDALRRLVANLADPEVAYVCGRLRLEDAAGSNREGLYWRYELWLREQESRLGSVTGGTARSTRSAGATTSRSTRAGATTSRSRTGWCRPGAARSTSPPRSRSRSRRRPTRPSTRARCGCSSTAGRSRCAARCCGACRRATSCRSSPTGCCATAAGCSTLRSSRRAWCSRPPAGPMRSRSSRSSRCSPRSRAGVPIARYYVYVTWATVQALWNYLRHGVPAAWDPAVTR